MQLSSGTVGLFSSVVLTIAAASGLAWVMAHPGKLAGAVIAFLPKSAPAKAKPTAPDADSNAAANATYGAVTLTAGDHGHFFAQADVNGRSIDVLVDTGASIVALTSEDAERAGIFMRPADFTHTVSTANGIARVAPVTIDEIAIGDITVRNVRAAVTEPGKLEKTLLGMSFLSRLSRVDMRDGELILQE